MSFEMNRHNILQATVFSPKSGAAAVKEEQAALGILPEWNLADLYPSPESSELTADLQKAGELSIAFEERWKGTLAAEIAKPQGGDFAQSIAEYEALDDLMGKIGSYAGLVYASD